MKAEERFRMTQSIPSAAGRTAAAHKAKADVLVVGLTAEGTVLAEDLKPALAKDLEKAAVSVDASGRLDTTARVPAPAGFAAGSVVLAGLGEFSPADLTEPTKADAALDALRRAAGSALRSITKARSVALALPSPDAAAAEAIATGAVLGAYRYGAYRSEGKAKTLAAGIEVLTAKSNLKAVERGAVIARGTCGARDFVNQPPLDLYPETFAAQVVKQAKAEKIKATVWDPAKLEAEGFGGLVGVGRGSKRGPRLVKLEYAPRRASKHLALVGKGITFDSGGISLKPAASMEDMKSDMGGAASAAQAIITIARLQLPVKVTAWLAMAENMPGADAQRPSDVITIYGGKTVEVTNTDAEGRLVLADALVAAGKENPDLIIDIATLTGAQIVALGNRTSGVMGRTNARNAVVLASEKTGEAMWPMPFPEELLSYFDSETADIKNSGKRPGGMLSAGVFLQEFVADEQDWAHIDIAGPSFNSESPWGYTPAEGTGVPVRTLVQVAENLA